MKWQKKSPNQETGLVNRGPLEALNDTKLVLNSGSLGGSTELEPTQMEMFNFRWLNWAQYLPLTPTRNNWHP